MKTNSMTFLKVARQSKKISQQKLASIVGVTQASISQFESGRRISPEIAFKIAEILDLDPSLLMLELNIDAVTRAVGED